MPKDYIPQGDSELLEFVNNFIDKISGNEAAYGLTAGDTAQMTALRDTFQTDYNDNLSKQIDAQTARAKKDSSRDPLKGKTRECSQRVQTFPGTTDAMRQELQITVKDTEQSSIGAPETRPVAEIEITAPLRHTINFYNEGGGGGKGKPDGVKGAEIFCKIGGEATVDEDDYKYLGTDTASPYLAVHKAENAGQKAHYLLRWVNPKNEPGAWSNPVSATITG